MRAYWKYEMKRSARLLIVLLAVCTLPFIIHCARSNLFSSWTSNGVEYVRIYDVFTAYVAIMMGALALFIPVYSYRFKMEKRSVDTWYALPIKRWKIYFVKTMVGLFLMIVPFTVAYLAGTATIGMRENYYRMGALVPLYFGLLFFGVSVYGAVAFLFTRANRLIDGLLFVGGYLFFLPLIFTLAISLVGSRMDFSAYDLSLFGGMTMFTVELSDALCGGECVLEWWWIAFPAVFGALGYFGLFFSMKFERAEAAEQISDSWFGYKVLIPTYVLFLVYPFGYMGMLSVVIASALGYVAYVIYRRKLRIEKYDWLCLGCAVTVGVILLLLTGY